MANYVKGTNFAAKDALPTGNPGKIVKGTEIDAELNAIASAVSSKSDTNSPTFTGTPAGPTAATETNTTQLATTAFARAAATAIANAAFFPAGTKMLFQQSTAPTGWTKDTTHNNKALRVVTGAVSSGGTVSFSDAFASRAITGTVASHTLTVAQMPLHGHPWSGGGGGDGNVRGGPFTSRADTWGVYPEYTGTPTVTAGETIGGTGGGQGHSHGLTVNNLDMAVQYVDLIIATKN